MPLKCKKRILTKVMYILHPDDSKNVELRAEYMNQFEALEKDGVSLSFRDTYGRFTKDALVVAMPKPIELDGVTLGPFDIAFSLPKVRSALEHFRAWCEEGEVEGDPARLTQQYFDHFGSDDFYDAVVVWPSSPSKAMFANEYPHPHVDDYGGLCMGDGEYPLCCAMLTRRDFYDAYLVIASTLNEYNPRSPHVELDKFRDGWCHCINCGAWVPEEDLRNTGEGEFDIDCPQCRVGK